MFRRTCAYTQYHPESPHCLQIKYVCTLKARALACHSLLHRPMNANQNGLQNGHRLPVKLQNPLNNIRFFCLDLAIIRDVDEDPG